jgi:hypothetical protein
MCSLTLSYQSKPGLWSQHLTMPCQMIIRQWIMNRKEWRQVGWGTQRDFITSVRQIVSQSRFKLASPVSDNNITLEHQGATPRNLHEVKSALKFSIHTSARAVARVAIDTISTVGAILARWNLIWSHCTFINIFLTVLSPVAWVTATQWGLERSKSYWQTPSFSSCFQTLCFTGHSWRACAELSEMCVSLREEYEFYFRYI